MRIKFAGQHSFTTDPHGKLARLIAELVDEFDLELPDDIDELLGLVQQFALRKTTRTGRGRRPTALGRKEQQ